MAKFKKASALVAGDTTEYYTVLAVRREGITVIADILWHDGGTGRRCWDDPESQVELIPVKRDD